MIPLFPLPAAAVLAAVHLVAGRLRFLDVVPRSRWLSLAGGVSVAYVFVRLLPELSAGQEVVQRAIAGELLAGEVAHETIHGKPIEREGEKVEDVVGAHRVSGYLVYRDVREPDHIAMKDGGKRPRMRMVERRIEEVTGMPEDVGPEELE